MSWNCRPTLGQAVAQSVVQHWVKLSQKVSSNRFQTKYCRPKKSVRHTVVLVPVPNCVQFASWPPDFFQMRDLILLMFFLFFLSRTFDPLPRLPLVLLLARGSSLGWFSSGWSASAGDSSFGWFSSGWSVSDGDSSIGWSSSAGDSSLGWFFLLGLVVLCWCLFFLWLVLVWLFLCAGGQPRPLIFQIG